MGESMETLQRASPLLAGLMPVTGSSEAVSSPPRFDDPTSNMWSKQGRHRYRKAQKNMFNNLRIHGISRSKPCPIVEPGTSNPGLPDGKEGRGSDADANLFVRAYAAADQIARNLF